MVAVNTRSRRILAKMYGRFYTIHLIVVLSQERSEGKFSMSTKQIVIILVTLDISHRQ